MKHKTAKRPALEGQTYNGASQPLLISAPPPPPSYCPFFFFAYPTLWHSNCGRWGLLQVLFPPFSHSLKRPRNIPGSARLHFKSRSGPSPGTFRHFFHRPLCRRSAKEELVCATKRAAVTLASAAVGSSFTDPIGRGLQKEFLKVPGEGSPQHQPLFPCSFQTPPACTTCKVGNTSISLQNTDFVLSLLIWQNQIPLLHILAWELSLYQHSWLSGIQSNTNKIHLLGGGGRERGILALSVTVPTKHGQYFTKGTSGPPNGSKQDCLSHDGNGSQQRCIPHGPWVHSNFWLCPMNIKLQNLGTT